MDCYLCFSGGILANPILSVCIPTYNRADCLKKTLDSIVTSDVFLNTDNIEVVISNNCSTDNTHELCLKYANDHPGKIKYINQETPVVIDIHIYKTIEYASGIYCKLNNDTCAFKENSLSDIVEYLKNNDVNAVFLHNQKTTKDYITVCKTYDEFINKVSYLSTWIGSFCIKKSVFESFENPLRCNHLRLCQIDLYGRLYENGYPITVLEKEFFELNIPENKGKFANYNVAEVFGLNYFDILTSYLGKNNGIQKSTIEKEKENIIKFINDTYFDYNNSYAFNKTGYYKYMKKYFGSKLYFWTLYIKAEMKLSRKNLKRKIKAIFGK